MRFIALFKIVFTIPVDKITNSKKSPLCGSEKREKGPSGKLKTGNDGMEEISRTKTRRHEGANNWKLKMKNWKWEIMNAETIENDSLIAFKSVMVKLISFAAC